MIYFGTADRQPRWPHSQWVVVLSLEVAICVFTLLAIAAGQGLYLGGFMLVCGLTLVVWRWPGWTAVALAALTPVNRFLILLVYHWTHSAMLVQFVQLYKDILVGLLVVRILYAAAFEKNPKTIKVLDLLVGAFFGLSLLYLLYPGAIDGLHFGVRLAGFRADAYFIVAYFVGRGISLRRQHLRWILLSLIPGSLVVSLVAALQFISPSSANAFFQSLEFSQFLKGEASSTLQLAVRDRGFAGQNLPRASSLLLGDLALAFYQVLLVSLAAALYAERQLRRFQVLAGVFLVAMIGTLMLTITRSAAIAIAPALVLIALFGRGFGKLMIVVVFVAVAAVGLIAAYGIEPSTLAQLTSAGEASVRGHQGALQRSLDLIQQEPLGRGFGTAGTIGQRAAFGQGITNENWYLQIASEMGALAGVLYLLCVAFLALVCFRASFRVKDVWLRVITLGMGGAAVAFLVVGNLLHAFEVPVLSILFWLLGGIAARAPELEVDPAFWERR
jgi:hypothetical protein